MLTKEKIKEIVGGQIGNDENEYGKLLESSGVPFLPSGLFLQVGRRDWPRGWVISLPAPVWTIPEVIAIILPMLVDVDAPFRIARNKDIACLLLDGSLGYEDLGKVISIYLWEGADCEAFAKHLVALTHIYEGPDIPSDVALGSLVYAHFGFFTSSKGNWHETGYTVPFSLPTDVSWPFGSMAEPIPRVNKIRLRRNIKIIRVLKPDAKGRVMAGLYYAGPLRVKRCIVKEGKKLMLADECGRDIRDRLVWQNRLYRELHAKIPMPEIYELFEDSGNLYLVMEFIMGHSFEDSLSMEFKGRNWSQIDRKAKLRILGLLQRIAKIIEVLHKEGYVHRDITPANFLVTKEDKILLIDMELSYCLKDRSNPPFKLGTHGFMSPEQLENETPTIKEDSYGIGALILSACTGLSPGKFDQTNLRQLSNTIEHLTGDGVLSFLICNCLSRDPSVRPNISTIRSYLEGVEERILNGQERNALRDATNIPEPSGVVDVINAGLLGLTNPVVFSNENRWMSPAVRRDRVVGNTQVGRSYQMGLGVGLSGILLLIARAKKLGYEVGSCMDGYQKSWEYLKENVLNNDWNGSVGLLQGKAGVAIAISAGISAELLEPSSRLLSDVKHLFDQPPLTTDLATGYSGQGLAALFCRNILDRADFEKILRRSVFALVEKQAPQGYWSLSPNGDGKIVNTSLSHGVTGILYYLARVIGNDVEQVTREVSIKMINRCLNWVLSEWKKTKRTTKNRNANQQGQIESFNSIDVDLLLAVSTIYKTTENSMCKEIGHDLIQSLPGRPVSHDFSIQSGLAKLGHIYLAAAEAFDSHLAAIKAQYVATFLLEMRHEKPDGGVVWVMDRGQLQAADLGIGASGIIYFLIEYCSYCQRNLARNSI